MEERIYQNRKRKVSNAIVYKFNYIFNNFVSLFRIKELKRKENQRLSEKVPMKKRETGLKAKVEQLKVKQKR